MQSEQIQQAVAIIKQGGVIAYPTEAVFGLGCDPLNEQAVLRILQLKQREVHKGLILLASSWQQVVDFTMPIPNENLQQALDSWPGPNTWTFPASDLAPKWITGQYNSIALRVTAHPVARAICEAYGGAIVSTSANPEGHEPARTAAEVEGFFADNIDLLIPELVGDLPQPTTIRDVISGQILRG